MKVLVRSSIYFSEKIKLDISLESSARQNIHMECLMSYFLWKKYFFFGMLSVTILLGPLTVWIIFVIHINV